MVLSPSNGSQIVGVKNGIKNRDYTYIVRHSKFEAMRRANIVAHRNAFTGETNFHN